MSWGPEDRLYSHNSLDSPFGRFLVHASLTDSGEEMAEHYRYEGVADAMQDGLFAISLFVSMPRCAICGNSYIDREFHSCRGG